MHKNNNFSQNIIMKKRITVTLSLMCVTIVMFALVIALNPKLTLVDEVMPIEPAQKIYTESVEPAYTVSQNVTNDGITTADNDASVNTPDETISPENTDQTDFVTPEPDVAPRPRFFAHFGYPTSAEDFLHDRMRSFFYPEYGIDLLDGSQPATDSTSNYYALYDEYDLTGENYQVIGQSFVLSNDSSYIDRFTRTASVVPHVRASQRPNLFSPTSNECNDNTAVETSACNGNPALSITPVSASDECDDDTAVETSATTQTLTPKYQITTIKKYPHASQIMHIVTIIASLLTTAFIGYLIYQMLKA